MAAWLDIFRAVAVDSCFYSLFGGLAASARPAAGFEPATY